MLQSEQCDVLDVNMKRITAKLSLFLPAISLSIYFLILGPGDDLVGWLFTVAIMGLVFQFAFSVLTGVSLALINIVSSNETKMDVDNPLVTASALSLTILFIWSDATSLESQNKLKDCIEINQDDFIIDDRLDTVSLFDYCTNSLGGSFDVFNDNSL